MSNNKSAWEKYANVVKAGIQFILLLYLFRWLYQQLPKGSIPALIVLFFFIYFLLILTSNAIYVSNSHVGNNSQWITAVDGCILAPYDLMEYRYRDSEQEVENAQRLLAEDRKLKKSLGMHRIWWWPWEDVVAICKEIARKNKIGYD